MATIITDRLSTLSVSQILPISYFRILCVLSFLSSFSVIRESNGHDKPHLLVRMFSSHYQTVLCDCLCVLILNQSGWRSPNACYTYPTVLYPFWLASYTCVSYVESTLITRYQVQYLCHTRHAATQRYCFTRLDASVIPAPFLKCRRRSASKT